jgi:hypothetical protein
MLNLTPESFLNNPLTKGINTKRNVRKSNSIARPIPGYSGSWIVNISAALTRSFREKVWRPRTAKIEGIRKKNEAEKKESKQLLTLQHKLWEKSQKKEAKLAAAEAKKEACEILKAANAATRAAAKEEKAREARRKKEERSANTKKRRPQNR